MPKRVLLLLFIILSLSLMTYQSNRKPLLPLTSLSYALNIIYGFEDSLVNYVKSPFKRMFLREEENARLKAEVSQLRKEQQESRETVIENKRLRDLLGLKAREPRFVSAARVIGRSIEQWSNTVTLDKGTSDGVVKDMTAVTDKGLVGKILVAYPSYSYLILLTDINFSAAARIQGTRTEGVVSGTGFKACRLRYIPHEEEVKKGDIIITSGLDMLFPPGIPIGYVSAVEKKSYGFFQEVEVRPFVDDSKTEVVAIIKR